MGISKPINFCSINLPDPDPRGVVERINGKPIVLSRIVWDTLVVDNQALTLYPLNGDSFSVINPTGHLETPEGAYFTKIEIPSTIQAGVLSFEYQFQDVESINVDTKFDKELNQYIVSDVMYCEGTGKELTTLPIPTNWKIEKYIELIFVPKRAAKPDEATTPSWDFGTNEAGFNPLCADGQTRVLYNKEGTNAQGDNIEWKIGNQIIAYYRVAYTTKEGTADAAT